MKKSTLEQFWFRLKLKPTALILCFYRNFCLKSGNRFSKIALAIGFISFIGLVSAGQAQQDTLAAIKQRGEVRLGVRESSGLAYVLDNGHYVGFHTQMAERIIDDIAKESGKPIRITYVPITSSSRMPLLQNGSIDFECGSTTNSAARALEVDFAYTTYIEEVRIVTKKNSAINSFADLDGKTIVTTTGTTSVQTLRRYRTEIIFNELQGRNHEDSFQQLLSGRADAFIMDGSIIAANISLGNNPEEFRILDDVLSVEPIACTLRLGDSPLKQAMNDSIERQIKDGSLEALYNRWFLEPIPPFNRIVGLPLSARSRHAWEHLNSMPMEDYPENKVSAYPDP